MEFFQLFQFDRIQYISFQMEYIRFLIQLEFIQQLHDELLNVRELVNVRERLSVRG